MAETRQRTLVRTLSYRFTALAITAVWTGLNTAIIIHIVLSVWHYIIERLWLKIKWGRIDNVHGRDI